MCAFFPALPPMFRRSILYPGRCSHHHPLTKTRLTLISMAKANQMTHIDVGAPWNTSFLDPEKQACACAPTEGRFPFVA